MQSMKFHKQLTADRVLLGFALVLVLAVGALGVWRVQKLQNTISENRTQYEKDIANLKNKNERLASQLEGVRDKITDLNDELEKAEKDLEDEKQRNDELEERVKEVTDTVGSLQNTVATEPELLKKYSRTFFLSENYEPANLAQIDDEYLYQASSLTVDRRVWPYLENLLEEAHEDGVDLLVTSAYRPFDQQGQLHERYTRVFGSGANQFSAQQGYSEHQLGTTIDFTTSETGSDLNAFANTEAYQWLQENADKYGFVLSYPEGNQYYTFEPWHWRFVGESLATDLKDAGDHFYQWSQRRIDEYRAEMFN